LSLFLQGLLAEVGYFVRINLCQVKGEEALLPSAWGSMLQTRTAAALSVSGILGFPLSNRSNPLDPVAKRQLRVSVVGFSMCWETALQRDLGLGTTLLGEVRSLGYLWTGGPEEARNYQREESNCVSTPCLLPPSSITGGGSTLG